MITSPYIKIKLRRLAGERERAASITKHLSNDCLRSDIDLKHHLMDDLKRQEMGEDGVYSYSDDGQLAGMGVWEDFKIKVGLARPE